LQNWTNEIFTIKRVKKTDPPTYVLKDFNKEEVKGSFYEQEIRPTKVPDLFLVEKVVRTRRDKDGELEYFVKWKGYDEKHNEWIKSLTDLDV